MICWLAMLALQVGDLTRVTYAAGYIPNIQFAPFYVADAKGYYAAEGIDLVMDYTIGAEVFKLVAMGRVDVGSADPDALLHAVRRGMPLVNIATLYQKNPLTLIAKTPILNNADLKGKRIGICGPYGSAYLGFKALLHQMGLSLADVHLISIGFTQTTALQRGAVDAVVGFINNEPILLNAMGTPTYTLELEARHEMPGVGLMTRQTTWEQRRPVIEGFLRATFKGMHDVLHDPRGSYTLVVTTYIKELNPDPDQAVEFRVLTATLPYWTSPFVQEQGYGQCHSDLWRHLADFLAVQEDDSAYASWQPHVKTDFHWKPEP